MPARSTSKASFVPLSIPEAQQIVGTVLQLDPNGASGCDVCERPDREVIDVDLLTASDIGSVAEGHQLAQRLPDQKWGGRDFGRVCSLLERHRRLHILRVFESIEADEEQFPDEASPTIRFSNWAVRALFDEYRAGDDSKARISALTAMSKHLQLRAILRGELEGTKKRTPEAIEVEAVLTDAQKRRLLEEEAKKLGLKVLPVREGAEPNKLPG